MPVIHAQTPSWKHCAGLGSGWSMIGLLLLAMAAQADDTGDTPRWSVSPMLGLFSPRLELLNDGEFKAPLPGQGRIILPDTGVNIDFDFVVENPLPSIRYGTDAGAEFAYRIDDDNTVFIGMSSWEASSTAVVATELPFQGVLSTTLYERTGTISYNQFYLGLSRRLWRRDRLSIHGLLSLHELYDVDFKEDMVFAFQSGPAATFKRLIVTQSQATGAQLIRLGLGLDYRVYRRFSLGLDMGYFASYRQFLLGNASLETDIQDQDNLSFRLPSIQDASGRIQYLAATNGFTANRYEPLKLDFAGWNLMFRANLSF